MVLLSELKEEFFDKILGQRILIIVSYTVDSLCTFKIIRDIFRSYNILFSYSVVQNRIEIKEHFNNYGEIENVLLINCGALFDIVEYLEMSETDERVIYLIDSQRPVHINNFYNQNQVKLLTFRENFNNVPEFDDVYMDDDDQEDDDSEEELEKSPKRRKLDETTMMEKIAKRDWRKKREDLMLEYDEGMFHGTSSSIVAYQLSYLISQDTMELLWCAVVGHTSHLVLHKVNLDGYRRHLDPLHEYLAKLTASRQLSRATNLEEISLEKVPHDLTLPLYRHWSLHDAFFTSPTIMKTFSLLNHRGIKRLNDFLAFLGIPLKQCDEIFSAMKIDLRNSVVSLIKEHCGRFSIPKEELFLSSFVAKCGYLPPLSALDTVYTTIAIMENAKDSRDSVEKISGAMKFMSLCDKKCLDYGLNLAKTMVKEFSITTKDMVDSNEIRVSGSFLQASLPKNKYFNLLSPMKQDILARFLLDAIFIRRPKMGLAKKTEVLPFILCSEIEENRIVLYGIPPLKSDFTKNLFRTLFITALYSAKSETEQNCLDHCRIEVNEKEKRKVYEKISLILTNKISNGIV